MKLEKIDTQSIPKLIFSNDEKRKEWENMDPQLKRSVTSMLKEYSKHMTLELTVDTLVQIISDMNIRIEKLEKNETQST